MSGASVLQFPTPAPAAPDADLQMARYLVEAWEARERRSAILAKIPATAKAVIVAEIEEDISESQTDYFASRPLRHVVIGFRMTARESFPALRKAAAGYPETAHMGPGLGEFRPRLVYSEDVETPMGRQYRGWYADQTATEMPRFDRRGAAEAFCAANPARRGTEWKIQEESFEHRENYSMGGGNYLKAGSRHSNGWTVFSRAIDTAKDGTRDFDGGSHLYEDGLPA